MSMWQLTCSVETVATGSNARRSNSRSEPGEGELSSSDVHSAKEGAGHESVGCISFGSKVGPPTHHCVAS